MPSLMNGKTPDNIIKNLDTFVDEVIQNGHGLIAGTRYKNTMTYYNMNNVYVKPDSEGDDLFMVNYQNGMSYSTTDEANLRSAIIEYLNAAIAAHSSSKATVQIVRRGSGLYDLDNMRLYTSFSEAKKNGHKNRSEHITSIATGKHFPI